MSCSITTSDESLCTTPHSALRVSLCMYKSSVMGMAAIRVHMLYTRAPLVLIGWMAVHMLQVQMWKASHSSVHTEAAASQHIEPIPGPAANLLWTGGHRLQSCQRTDHDEQVDACGEQGQVL